MDRKEALSRESDSLTLIILDLEGKLSRHEETFKIEQKKIIDEELDEDMSKAKWMEKKEELNQWRFDAIKRLKDMQRKRLAIKSELSRLRGYSSRTSVVVLEEILAELKKLNKGGK